MSKDKTLKVAYIEQFHGDGPRWKVMQVTDSLTPLPGAFLTKDQMRDYCDMGMWKVTIVPHK